ncbi:MAG TPA: hypothetical protein VJP77_03830, partial [Planctomycetota bacterium]|nr:hypothetical protein [Planctomycetota bacterium]
MNPTPTDVEPRPLAGEIRFEEGDFHALSDGLCGDPQYDDVRLRTRRKLGTLAKRAAAGAAAAGLALESRTSLHHPRVFNGMRVRRLWAYLTRAKAEKAHLRRTLGPDLAKDLDAAYRNAYLCLAVESDALEASFRIHADAWFDGRNLVRRLEREGRRPLLDLLNALDGFRLRLHDWKGEWRCGKLEPEQLDEFLRYYTPGEHAFAVERRFPAPPGARDAACSPEAAD